MTTLKIQGKPSASASQALSPHVQSMYDRPAKRHLAVIELAQVERSEPAPDADKDRSVTMRVSAAEIGTGDHGEVLRDVMRALYVQRTATGTIDEEGQLILSSQTLKDAAGILGMHAVAQFSAGVHHWRDYVGRVCGNQMLTIGELRHELDTIRDGLSALLLERPPLDGE